MGERTAIAWAHSTFNPWWGCTKVGPGCDHCYAEAMDRRIGGDHWGPGKPRRMLSDENWRLPFRWNDKAAKQPEPWRVFCASMADVFDNEVDPSLRSRLWYVIQETPCLTWMLLTKRIGNVAGMLPEQWRALPKNVWLGITVVNQEEAKRDIPKLMAIDARIRWLSIEPQLEPIDLAPFLDRGAAADNGRHEFDGIDWVITGGESGHHAREYHTEWAVAIVKDCRAAGVPVFVKQLGSNPVGYGDSIGFPSTRSYFPMRHIKHPAGGDPVEWPEDLRVQQFPT